ncbi:retention module-containing protein [Metapseudomonas furukawaii]
MAGSIGVVRQVIGEVFAVAANGARRPLSEGDRVFVGEELVTGANGAVAVRLTNGQELVLGRESSMPLDNSLLAGSPDKAPGDADAAPAAPSQQDLTDVEKLQAAIEAGVDPTQVAEATAAGPGGAGGAGGGGHSFVLLGETAGRVDPSIGFPTGPISFGVDFPQPETGLPDVPLAAETPENGVPVAVDDDQSIDEGQESVQGNVLDNDDGGPDLPTQFVSWQAPGASEGPGGSLLVSTPYGVVTLNPDGSYSFQLANGTPAVEGLGEGETVSLEFGYSIQDGNGDQSSANLNISIIGRNDIPTIEVNFPDATGGVVQVFERGLPGGSSEGDGSNVVHGTFTIRDPDGLEKLSSLSVGGLDLPGNAGDLLASLIGRGFEAAHGTVRITGFDASTGTFSFSYTLTRPLADLASGEERDGFLIRLSDGLGLPVSTNVSIEIVDDLPTANADSRSLTENGEPASVTGNVLDNDVGGADQPKSFTSWNGVAGATPGEGGSLLVNTPYGLVTLFADGSYSFTLANGSAAVEALTEGQQVSLQYAYSMQDDDGDPSSSTLTLTLIGSNDIPTVEVNFPGSEGGAAQVFEQGLPGGSSAGDGSTVVNGTFTVADADGLANLKTLSVGSLTLDLTSNPFSALVGQSFTTAHGTVQITGYSNGTYSFSYTLTEATTDAAGLETDGFLINVGDGSGTASATVTIEIVDDVPTANADSRSLTENGEPASVTGNVLDNDVGGADQPKSFTSWNGVAGATPGEGGSLLVNTPYGLVTLFADGRYSFTLANGSAAVEGLDQGQQVSLQFAYSMRDGDNDPSDSTLTLTITGSNDVPTIEVSTPNGQGDLAQVFEKGLANGSSAGDGSNVTTGSFTVGDSDGLDDLSSLSVGSLTLDLTSNPFSALVGQSFTTAHGTVQITGYSNGTYSFAYTLTEATTDAAGLETDGFTITVSDGIAPPVSAPVTIEIVDDVPTANADSRSLTENGEPASVTGNVLDNDVGGADQPKSFTSWNGVAGATPGEGGSLLVNTPYGLVTLFADGRYSFTLANGSAAVEGLDQGQQVSLQFAYSMRDGDNDPSDSTLTLTITGSNDVPTIEVSTPNGQGDLAQVFEKGLANGSSAGDGSNVTTGSFTVGDSDGLDDLSSLSVGSLTLDLTSNPFSALVGQSFTTAHGTVQITGYSNGTYSFAYTLTEATTDAAGPETDGFTITVSDGIAPPVSAPVTIEIVDDLPDVSAIGLGNLKVEVDETLLGVSDSENFAGAFSRVFGADGPNAVNSTLYSLDVKSTAADSGLRDAQTNGSILLYKEGNDVVGRVAGSGDLAFRITVAADGTVTLLQSRAILHSPDTGPNQPAGMASDLITLEATITDGDGDVDSAKLDLGGAFSFLDDAPTVTANPYVRLDDDTLSGGIAGGVGDDADSVNAHGFLGFDFGADGGGSVQWLTSGAPDGFSYSMSGSTLLVKQGGNTVLSVTLDGSTGEYQVTQLANILHEDGLQENNQVFNLTYQVTDKDGDSTTGSLKVDVDDDTPQAKDDVADVAEGRGQDFNVVFVLDFSGSIDDSELDTMLDAVRSAGQALFSGTDGDVRIQLVAFSGTAASYPMVTDVTSFTQLVNSLNPQEGGTRPFNGNTDFTAAIQQTMSVYTPIPGWSNQVFFISDGNPNEQTGPNGESLTNAVAGQWNNFVDSNGINVVAIGVGNGISTPRLQDIDVDGSGTPILVSQFGDLVDTLASQILGGVVSGNVLRGSDNQVGGGDDDAFGADGAERILSIEIGGTTYTWNGSGTISLSTGGALSGSSLENVATAAGGKLSFDFTTGNWTYVAPQNVAADTSESFVYAIVDRDGDPSSAVLTVRIEDAAPVIGRVDEDELPGGITDGDSDTTVVSGNLSDLLVGTPSGAQFSVASTPLAMPVLTSDGVTVTYSTEGDTLVAKAGSETVFTLLVQSNGNYTFTLVGALDHPSGAGGDDQILTLNLTGALQASNDSGSLPLAGDLLIQVEDDIPAILQTSNLVYANTDNPGGASGIFVYSTGADTRGSGPFSASDSDFAAITLSGTVGGAAISSAAVAWASESATSATFDISFSYAPNPASPGILEQASGTLTFDKVNGTYSVSLDEPIQGFTIFKTSTSLSITGYESDSAVVTGSQPDVAVVKLDNDFYVQYTSYAEPGGGTGSNNLNAGASSTSTFTDGELFSQQMSWVSVSNQANGVAGDTLGKGEVLDLNFYTADPKGFLGVEPSARAAGMFLKFDGVGSEDLVVVLKLVGANGLKTTRALLVSNADIMTANSVALAAYGIFLDNNDGAIVIEGNDFNAPGENWQIYGAQVLTSVEGISSSSAINFNSIIGDGGASNVSGRVSFTSSDTDNDVLKVSDVGFITGESNTLDSNLNFEVAVRDADGDTTSTQVLQVNLEAGSTFVGTATADSIRGTSGDDHLTGLGGDDVLWGGSGNDTLDGGAGIDTASYEGATSAVTVDLSLAGAQDTGGAGLDTLIDMENLIGSSFDDVLIGNDGDNLLAGNGGDDTLTGGGGADTFKWMLGDTGITTVTGFTPGLDSLDLSQLLTGEHGDSDSLEQYLTMAFGADTTITVDSNSQAIAGGTGQTIVLEGVNLLTHYSAADTASVITSMLDDGSLKVDV